MITCAGFSLTLSDFVLGPVLAPPTLSRSALTVLAAIATSPSHGYKVATQKVDREMYLCHFPIVMVMHLYLKACIE